MTNREINIARGKPITASAGAESARLAVDNDLDTSWTARAFPPQWIEVNLEGAFDIQKIRLFAEQEPPGNTEHKILGKGTESAEYTLLHTFVGDTESKGVLEFSPAKPWVGVRFLRIQTERGPAWVSWREIEINVRQQ